LDLFAPGVNITSAFYTDPTAFKVWSGTSMASPHVAGVAALFLGDHPTASPAQVADSILAFTTKAVVQNAWSVAHNLLYSQPLVQRDTTPPPPVPDAPSSLSASVGSVGRTTVVNLAWSSASVPVAESEVQRKISGGTWEVAGWTFDGWSQYQDYYVSSGQTYTYRVRSSTPYGVTGWSDEVTITVGNAKKGGGRSR
jgi:hypothetical protein